MFPITRRSFVGTAAASLGGFAFLEQLPEAVADTAPRPLAKVESDVEPLVRLIEDTSRDRLMEQIVERIHKGTSYQDLLAAVFLAGVRGIQPRPVGFKFHAVLVINSAHQATLAANDKDRWLPLLWSIDYFKSAQATNKTQGDWRMAPVPESKLPKEHQAKRLFLSGMNNWDLDQADRGIAAWTRSGSAVEVFEPLWLLGARDFRDIGHKAIYVANAWRTLQTIGWRHAEPVMRSLAYALLDHEGTNPATRDGAPDRPGRDNLRRIDELNYSFTGRRDPNACKQVLEALRTASAADAGKMVATLLEDEIHPACIWDGLFLQAGELLMRQPGIVGLHTLTTLNALHFAYETCAVPRTRIFTLFQAASFLPLFRDAMVSRGKVSDGKLDGLSRVDGKDGIEEIFAEVPRNRQLAAQKTIGLLTKDPTLIDPLMKQARRLVFAKGTDSHDYKFSSAILEDVNHLAPGLRPMFMAASMFHLKGSGDKDNGLIKRAQSALAKA